MSPSCTSLHGTLSIFDVVFKNFRNQFKSDELFSAILIALEHTHDPVLAILGECTEALPNTPLDHVGEDKNADADLLLGCLSLCTSVLFSLVWQDLPEVVEDNLDTWMSTY